MAAPRIPFRKFKEILAEHNCTAVKLTKEWGILNAEGKRIGTFAVTHGKEEVKMPYVTRFKKLMTATTEEEAADQEGNDE